MPAPISIWPTLLTPLSAITSLPSGVLFMLRITPPPPGTIQVWNFSVLRSHRSSAIGRCLDDLDISGLRVEPADIIRVLRGEEEHAVRCEERRVRIANAFRHLVFRDVARLRIELADVALRVRREPQIAGFVERETVRA